MILDLPQYWQTCLACFVVFFKIVPIMLASPVSFVRVTHPNHDKIIL